MKHKNLTILGTSHIAKQSLKDVEDAIIKAKPGIVALELDRKRLAALLDKNPPKVRLRISFQPYRSMGREKTGKRDRSKPWKRDEEGF